VIASAHRALAGRSLTGRVVTAHRRAVNVLDPGGQLWSVVDAGVGNGPATAVLAPGCTVLWREGDWVAMDLPPPVQWWEPPAAPAWGLFAGNVGDEDRGLFAGIVGRLGQEGLACLLAGRWAEAVRRLAGFGPGLTPSGDDALCGAVVALHRAGAHTQAGALAAAIRTLTPADTTPLSLHLLCWAADGVAGEDHLTWLDALIIGRPIPPHRLLAHGATSGADWAAGALAALHRLTGAHDGPFHHAMTKEDPHETLRPVDSDRGGHAALAQL
jgi:hypothetical protein